MRDFYVGLMILIGQALIGRVAALQGQVTLM